MLGVICLLLNAVFFIDVESTEVLCNQKEELSHFDCLISEDIKRVCTRNIVKGLHFWLASLSFTIFLIQCHMKEWWNKCDVTVLDFFKSLFQPEGSLGLTPGYIARYLTFLPFLTIQTVHVSFQQVIAFTCMES